MTTIPSEIFMKLWEVFPDCFSVKGTAKIYETYNGPWGTEEIFKGTQIVTLSEFIANTANAISRGGRYMEKALAYIDTFKSAKVQAREIKNFYDDYPLAGDIHFDLN